MAEFTITPLADLDIERAREWYNDQQAGVGYDFVAAVDRAFDKIRANPELFSFLRAPVRHTLVQTFPFVILYTFEAEQITILAVYHTSRDSDWKRRLTN